MGQLIELQEYKELKSKYRNLKELYIMVEEEKEDLIHKEIIYYESKYLSIFGDIIYKKLDESIEIRRLRRKIGLVQGYINNNRKIDFQAINKTIEEELKDFFRQQENLKQDIKSGKEYIELPELSNDEIKYVKKIFRTLAKKFHPDLNSDLSTKKRRFWDRILKAYENNDLEQLRLLSTLLEDQGDVEEVNEIDDIKANIEKIKNLIKKTEEFIHERKNEFPLNIKGQLSDEQWIINEKECFTQEVENLITERKFLENHLDTMGG
ncbi:J domain-containing protein [Clostridium sp.]|uniref:J domain-containing protein n=1 Tax=Clostridium sp. TaxID=1506 RepID=UPI0032179812